MNTAANLLYLDTALALASSAGALLSQGAHARQPAQSKGVSTDLVTKYDRAAEELIIAGLRARHPDHRILAEESGDRLFHGVSGGDLGGVDVD